MLNEDDGELCECRAAVHDLQGMLKRSESRKALGYFLDEFWTSTPVETKALDHIRTLTILGCYEESGRVEHRVISDELRAARHMFRRIGEHARRPEHGQVINFIEAAYITPVNKAQST
ncbi:hypothetical protein [Streptomyces goshikiensis]|uniref:hypothetical protein n=1 Tax=Streptomyces goshikiensis TaxID=1942 RepID=UPI003674A528